MHTPPHIQGWCPGAWQPMASGDGLVVRVRPPLGRLTVAQARRLARLALVHGTGVLELSSRANVQLRGIAPGRHAAVLRALAAVGLLDADAGRERRRNLVIDPLCRPQEAVHALGQALQQALDAADDLAGLPAKFGWSVEGAPGRLAGVSADIRLQRTATGWLVQPDGRQQALAVADTSQAVAAGLALARWFAGQASFAAPRACGPDAWPRWRRNCSRPRTGLGGDRNPGLRRRTGARCRARRGLAAGRAAGPLAGRGAGAAAARLA